MTEQIWPLDSIYQRAQEETELNKKIDLTEKKIQCVTLIWECKHENCFKSDQV